MSAFCVQPRRQVLMKDIRILLLILILGSRCALSVGIADAQNALGCTNVTVRGFYNMELNFMADEDGNKYLPDDEDAYYKSGHNSLLTKSDYWTKDSGGLKAKLSTRFRGTRIVFQVTGSGIFALSAKGGCGDYDYMYAIVNGEPGELIVQGHDYDDFEEHEIIIPPASGLVIHTIILEYLCEGYNKDEKPTAAEDDYYANYQQCIWIKNVRFTPYPIELALDSHGTQNAPEVFTGTWTFKLEGGDGDMAEPWDFGYTVRYTMDGTEPGAGSTIYERGTHVPIDKTCQVRVRVFDGTTPVNFYDGNGDGTAETNEITAFYREKAPKPTLELTKAADGLTYTATMNVEQTGTQPVSIYYNLAGGNPNRLYTKPFTIGTACDLVVQASGTPVDNMLDSEQISATIRRPAKPVCQLDHVTPNGTFVAHAILPISDAVGGGLIKVTLNPDPSDEGAVVWYTDNGNDPQDDVYAQGNYSGNPGVSVSMNAGTIKARSFYSGEGYMLPSELVSVNIRYAPYPLSYNTASEPLPKGWNLIGFPGDISDFGYNKLADSGWILYGYDAKAKTYSVASTIKGGHGYWVFNDGTLQELMLTCTMDDVRPLPNKGWGLLTRTFMENQNQNAEINDMNVWRYNEKSEFSPDTAKNLHLGIGFWLYSP